MLNISTCNSMDNNNVDIQKCLLELSGTIDNLLVDDNPQLLDYLEDWTKTHYHKIRLKQNHNQKIILKGFDEKEPREDALFIFNADFKVIFYSGTQNFFSGTGSNNVTSINLLDIIEDNDIPKVKALFNEAVKSGNNSITDLQIKGNISILNKCTLEIDMVASNPSTDRYIAKLRFSEILTSQLLEYQALILDNLPGMDIYLFDTDFKYLFAGGREKERFDLSNVQLIGQSAFDVLDSKAVRLIYPFVSKALQGVLNEGEIKFENEIYFLRAVPVADFNNKNIAAILFSQNITQDKELETQLKSGREEALKADKFKSIFIANISHEIRTPLSAIIGFTEQLQKTRLDLNQEKLVKLINKASDHLLYLVTEIVYLFKLGMGKVFIEKKPFSLKDLLSELSATFNEEACSKNLNLELGCDGEFPDVLIGDLFRLRQILINLLTNAIKFTDTGTVSLQCSVVEETKKQINILFKISDTGIGISRSDLKIIFNVFEQGNKLNVGSRGGAGLGLGICKNLVELLDGTITVKSKLNTGSVFKVNLPFDKPGPTVSIPPAEIEYMLETDNYLLEGKKILLADDDEHNLILAEYILESWKTNYLLVNNGQKAIDALALQKFDMALIDIHMPVKNGLDVIAWLRSDINPLNSKTPVIFITANIVKTDLNHYLKAGFDDYLIKPFREKELYNKLCNILIVNAEEHEQTEPTDLPGQDTRTKDIFDVQDLLLKANGNRFFYEKMLNNFISNTLSLKDLFLNIVDLENLNEIGEKTHKSIPSFKYFGLTNLAGQLEIIEDKTLRNIDLKRAREVIKRVIPQIDNVIEQAEEICKNCR